VLDTEGNPCRWIGVISDISDRKEAEEQRNLALAREKAARRQAEASEQLYRVLAEAIPQIVWTASEQTAGSTITTSAGLNIQA
jgi:PAS domain-containing protein